jgi:outer membrane murein-binding lipoprotein Lpp
MEEPPRQRQWSGSLVGMVTVVILLLAGMVSLGIVYEQDQSKIQTLSSQVSDIQTQLSNLQSRNSNLQAQNSNLSTYLSQYEKTIPLLNVASTCNPSDPILTLTNFGSQPVTVPASGVKVLSPNGATYLPTPGTRLTFQVFSTDICILPSLSSSTSRTSVTVPPGGEAWISIDELSLLWLAPQGNYVITFSGVTTASGGQVSVSPLLVSWTGPPVVSISYTSFTASGPTGQIFIQNNEQYEDATVQPYQVTLSYGNASCSESYYPPPFIAPRSGYALTWTYSSGYPCPNTQATNGEAFSGNVMFSYGLNGTFELLFTGSFQP